MDFDEILDSVGQFGRYQKTKYLLVCFVWIVCGMQMYASVFTIETPQHRCSLPSDILNSTDTWQNQSAAHSALVDQYIPVDSDGKMDNCYIYSSSMAADSNRTKVKCDSWVYDKSERDETIVTKFDLVCDKKFTSTLLTSLYMFGTLAGSVTNGIISDIHGRRMALLIGCAAQCISGVALSFSPDVYTVGVFRFVMGVSTLQMILSAFVMGMEIVGSRYRLAAGIVIQIAMSTGFSLLVGLAYALRDIMSLQLMISLPALLFISYYWFLPESARWLLVRGRVEEATEIIHNIAKTNGTEVPSSMKLFAEEERKPENIGALRHAPRLILRAVIVACIWMVVSMSYYGLSLNSGHLPGSLYENSAFSSVSELLGYLVCFLCFKAGRKWTHAVSMSIGGLSLMSSVLVHYYFNGDEESKNWVFIGLNQLGKIGATTGFAIIYFWSAEIFPTVLRNTLIGACSVVAKIGAIMAPYVSDIGNFVPSQYSSILPPLIFGVLTIVGGLLAIGLPETTGCDLPETIAEANELPKSKQTNSNQEAGERQIT